MFSRTMEVPVPNVKLTLGQLLTAIQQLDKYARIEVAQTLLKAEMDANLKELIKQLAQKSPVNDISDADIDMEVRAVRQSYR